MGMRGFGYGDGKQPGLRFKMRSGVLSEANQAIKSAKFVGNGFVCIQLVLNVITFAFDVSSRAIKSMMETSMLGKCFSLVKQQ